MQEVGLPSLIPGGGRMLFVFVDVFTKDHRGISALLDGSQWNENEFKPQGEAFTL